MDQMLGVQFGSINAVALWCHDEEKDKRHVHIIPSQLDRIDSVISILNEIETSYRLDLESHRDEITEILEKGCCSSAQLAPYLSREVWRIGSYIIFACTLERNLEKSYHVLVNTIKVLSGSLFSELESYSRGLISEAKKDLKAVRLVRNKVFAHTSYSCPKKDDSLSMQASSLLYLTGNGTSFSPEGVRIGSVSIRVEGDKSPNLPSFRFVDVCKATASCVTKWHTLHQCAMKRLLELSDDEIMRNWPVKIEIIGRNIDG